MTIEFIAFDADDTLWENEIHYLHAQDKLKSLLSRYLSPQDLDERLYETEANNLAFYGYGIKSFTLSMIETAITLTQGHIQAAEIAEIIGYGKGMLRAELQLMPFAAQTIRELSDSFPLMLITKGDLLDQRRKLERSGLGDYFDIVEVVSEKSRADYRGLLSKHAIQPGHFMMVGNSLRSDVLPVVAEGGYAVYIPYENTWAHENIEVSLEEGDSFFELEHLGQLPAFIATRFNQQG
jgi:putative hydrolase of the HAD superfamily